MPQKLESFYSIDHWNLVDGKLIVRFIPDFLATELVDPVLTATVIEPLDVQAAESGLTTWQVEMIVDIQASEGVLEVWGEYDDTPFSIRGREVRLTRSAYSSQDLVRVIERIRAELDSFQAESRRLRNHIHEVGQFVVDLLNRAEARKAMSSRNPTASDAQIDALSRVLSHLRSA